MPPYSMGAEGLLAFLEQRTRCDWQFLVEGLRVDTHALDWGTRLHIHFSLPDNPDLTGFVKYGKEFSWCIIANEEVVFKEVKPYQARSPGMVDALVRGMLELNKAMETNEYCGSTDTTRTPARDWT